MATGTVTFSASDYPARSLVTVTKWAGALPIEHAVDEFYGVGPGVGDLTLHLDGTTGSFCYRFVVETPATLEETVRFVAVEADETHDYADLVDVDPTTFLPTPITPTLIETIEQVIADNPAAVDPEDIETAVDAYFVTNPKADDPHTHAQADVTGLVNALAALAPLVHTHALGDVTGLVAALTGKSDAYHTHTSAGITDFTEAAQDAVAALLAAGTNVTLSYNDAGNSLTVNAAGGSFDAEAARDALGVALVGLGNITVTVNDALDTITLSTTATVNSTDAALRDRSTHTGSQLASTISDFATAADLRVAAGITGKLDTSAAPELIRDTMGTALVAGTNVTITVNDAGDTITIAATGGGGGITIEDARDAVAAMLIVTGNATGTNNDAGDTYTINVPGVPTFIQTTEPTEAGPLLWVRDLGSGAFSLAIKTP